MKGIKYCNKCGDVLTEDNWSTGDRKRYRHACKICETSRKRNYSREIKLKIVMYYGNGMCACCKESNIEFLAVDHINGNGNKHRLSIGVGSGWHFYRWLIKNNYPPGFRILCHNCNQALGNFGACPHTKEIKGARIIQIPAYAGMQQYY